MNQAVVLQQDNDFTRDMISVFYSRKGVILGTTAVVLIMAILVSFYWPATYTVTGSILVKNRQLSKSPEAIENTVTRVWEVDMATMTSEMKIITSGDVIASTLDTLNSLGMLDTSGRQLTADEQAVLMDTIVSRLKTKVLPSSNIIQVSLTGNDPELTTLILDALLQHYIQYRWGVFSPSEAREFYKGQADTFNVGLQQKDDDFLELADSSNSANPEKEIQNNLELKKNLETQLEVALKEHGDLSYEVKHLQKMLLQTKGVQFFASIDNGSIAQLGNKLQELYIERGNLMRIFTDNSSKVTRITRQIDRLNQMLRHEVQGYVGGLSARVAYLDKHIAYLNGKITMLEKRNLRLNAIIVQQKRILAEAQVLEESYKIFAKRSEEARISSASNVNTLFSISILSKPTVPGAPSFPDKKKVIPLGLIIGLLLGVSFGFLFEYIDRTCRYPKDVALNVGLPTLFSVPDWSSR